MLRQHTYYNINNWGAHFDDRAFRIFRNGWIDSREAFHVVLFITLYNELKMSEHGVYWLTDYPLIIYWACSKKQLW